MTKNVMPQMVALKRRVVDRVNDQKDGCGTNAEETGETTNSASA